MQSERFASAPYTYNSPRTETTFGAEKWSDSRSLQARIEHRMLPDQIDHRSSEKLGGTMRMGLKDVLRQLRFKVWQVVLSIYGFTPELFRDEVELQAFIYGLTPQQLHLAQACATHIFANWDSYTSGILVDEFTPIVQGIKTELFDYLLTQVSTQLGEALVFDPTLIENSNLYSWEKAALKAFLDSGHALQQREFGKNYFLDDSSLPGMIQSAARRLDMPAATPREQAELDNLLLLKEGLAQPDGQVWVEISTPYHSHQTQTMLRIYQKTSRGWYPDIFYLPHLDEWSAADLLRVYTTELSRNGISPQVVSSPDSNVPMFAVPNCDIDFLINKFPLMHRLRQGEVTGLDVVRTGDKVVKPKLESVMPYVFNLIDHSLANFVNTMVDDQEFGKCVDRFERVIHAISISFQTDEKLIQQGLTSDAIANVRTSLIQNALTAETDVQFNQYVSANIGKLNSSMSSDCLVSERTFGSGVRAEGVTKGDLIVGKDGSTVQFLSVDGKTHIANCPMCGYAGVTHPVTGEAMGIDICDSHCPNCKQSIAEMRTMFEKGTLKQAQQRFRNANDDSSYSHPAVAQDYSRIGSNSEQSIGQNSDFGFGWVWDMLTFGLFPT